MPRPTPPIGTRRITRSGYVVVRMPSHPRSSTSGYVYEHVLVAEKALGRLIPISHPIHHHNQIRIDNRQCNLVICEDKAYHLLLHARMRVLSQGGDPNTQKMCDACQVPHDLTAFGYRHRYHDGLDRICKSAKAKLDRIVYLRRIERGK